MRFSDKTMTEIWKPVAGYEGYAVSNLGRVRSLDRQWAQRSRNGNAYVRSVRGRVLRARVNEKRGGYRYIDVGVAGSRVSRRVCGLVAAAFVGPRSEGQVVRHKNGAPADDRAINLCYGTQSDNNRDAVRHGTFLSPKRVAHLRRIAPLGGRAAHA
jgi:hypothetical protein